MAARGTHVNHIARCLAAEDITGATRWGAVGVGADNEGRGRSEKREGKDENSAEHLVKGGFVRHKG